MFWAMMVILALTLSGFYVKHIQKKVAGVSLEDTKEEMDIHSLEEIIDKVKEIEIPRIEMPGVNREALKDLQKMMEEMPEETTEEELEKTPMENNHNETIE